MGIVTNNPRLIGLLTVAVLCLPLVAVGPTPVRSNPAGRGGKNPPATTRPGSSQTQSAGAGAQPVERPGAWTEKDLEALFARSARWQGAPYVVARNLLVRRGKAIATFLKRKARSADWRERNLAAALLLRIERPEAALWALVFKGYDYYRFTFRNDGTVLVKFAPGVASNARLVGRILPQMDGLVVDRRSVPIIFDAMREVIGRVGSSGSREERAFGRCVRFLHHFADLRSVEALVDTAGRVRKQDPVIAETLVKIGKPALPALRQAARKGDGNWYDVGPAILAVQVLGQLGDAESAPMLIETLDKLKSPDTIAAYCRTLAKFGTRKCADAVFAQLLNCAKGWPGRKHYHDSRNYFAIREPMLAFGDKAKPVLKNVVKTGNDTIARAIAQGMLWELTNPKEAKASYAAFGKELTPHRLKWWTSGSKDKKIDLVAVGRKEFWRRRSSYAIRQPEPSNIPEELLIERAAALPGVLNLAVIGRLKGNDLAFDVLAAAILHPKGPYRYDRRVILALAELGNPKAVDVYGKILLKHPTHYIGMIAEALLLLDEPKGAKVLRQVIGRKIKDRHEAKRYKEQVVPLAEAVLSALEGKPEPVVKLLESKQQPLRLAAARYLARKSDVRAVPVLLAETSAANWDLHTALREQIVSMGKVALDPLGKIRADAKDNRQKLLCESIRLRITNPKLVKTFERASGVRAPGFMSHAGPSVHDYRFVGKHIAKAVGPEAVPLLEAAIVWGRNGSAAFALAEFKQERSIDVLVKYCVNVGWARGGSIAAHALKEFGPAGIAAARKVPAADPNKVRFDRRVMRHRTAAEALGLAKDPKGVEEIVKGLELAAAGKIKPDRTRVYMRLARKYHDKRLIGPIIKALEKQGHRDNYLADLALVLLSRYKDDRIVQPCLKYLFRGYSPGGSGLIGLARVKGNGLASFLAEQARQSGDENIRIGTTRALAWLLSRREACFPKDTPKPSKEALSEERRLLYRTLVEMLKDPGVSVQRAAADRLAGVLDPRGNKSDTAALIAWADGQDHLSQKVVWYLAWTKDPNISPLLLKVFRRNPAKGYHPAKALSDLRYEKAVPDVAAELRRFIEAKDITWGIRLMDVLAGFGKVGCKEVYDIMQRHEELIVKVEAASSLARYSYDKGFAETQKLFEELIANGPTDPRVKRWYGRDRLETYRAVVNYLARSLLTWNAKAAHPIILNASLKTKDAHLRKYLAGMVL